MPERFPFQFPGFDVLSSQTRTAIPEPGTWNPERGTWEAFLAAAPS
jgi:hypothetical protein